MTTLPDGWRAEELGSICRVYSGATPKTSVAEYWGNDVPWVTPADLARDRSQALSHGARGLSWSGYRSCAAQLVPRGSVVVSSRAPIGYVAIAGAELATNQGCKTAAPPGYLDSKYLYWYLVHSKPDLDARASGTTFKEISGKEFGRTVLRFPDLDKQRQIVDTLEDHLSRLDAAATDLAAVRLRRDRLAQAAADELWTRSAASAPSRRLSEIGNVITGNTPPTRLGDAFDGDLPFITPGDVHHGTQIRDWQRTLSGVGQKSARVLPSGAVLTVCIGASIGKTGWIDRPSATNQQINAVVANSTSARPDYLAALFASPAFQRQITENASSTTLPILNKSKFERLAVPVAPRWTQDGLMSRLDTIRNMSADLGDASSAAERRSSSLRHALLAAAFSGRLTGRSSDLDIAEELMPA